MGSQDSKKVTVSRWQKFTLTDLACLLYWGSFFTSFCIIVDWPVDFREALGATTPVRKFVVLYCFWIGSIVLGQFLFGFKGMLNKMWQFAVSPLAAIQVLVGFWWDSWSLITRVRKQIPWSIIFWSGLIILPTLTWHDNDPAVLKAILIPNWLMLGWLIVKSFKWSLNPLPFVGEMKFSDKNLHIKKKVVDTLATVKAAKVEDGFAEMLKSLNNLKMISVGVPKVMDFLSSPKTLFFFFLGIFAFVGSGSVLFVTGILRILNLTTPNGIFEGTGFNGTFLDYLYISMSHFIGGQMYHIDLKADNVRYVLLALPVIGLILTVLLITAFTLFFQTKVEKTANDGKRSISEIIEDAVALISKDRRVVIEAPKPAVKSDIVMDAKNLNKTDSIQQTSLTPPEVN